MALHRRARERTLAHEAAAAAIEVELKSTVAGLLLHSQLALADRDVPAPLAEKLRVVARPRREACASVWSAYPHWRSNVA